MYPSAGSPSPPDGALERDHAIRCLADEFVEVAVQLSLLQVRQVDIAQQLLAQRGAIVGSVPHWLSLRAGLSCREAKQLCRVARRLPQLPLIDAAFRGGRLSLDTADVLAKVATPENESVLLETAGAATGAQLRKIVSTFRRVRDHDHPEPDREERASCGADDEMWWMAARLQHAHGAEVEAALRAAREDLWSSSDPDVAENGARPAVSTSDALVHICRQYLEPKVSASGRLPERFLTIVHVDLTDVAQAAKRPDDVASLRGIGPIDAATLGTLLCDSLLSVVQRDGVDVTATAAVRLATPAQRKALLAMHPTCQFPGCGRTQYLQAHHVEPHPSGPTALGNLALLCDEHHTVVHKAGWRAALTEDHVLLVWQPDGALLTGGALRPEGLSAEFAKCTTTGPTDVRRRLHGVGDRLDAWALDVTLHAWLEATAA